MEESTTNIDISHGLYNFIELKDLQHHLEANNLVGKCIYNNNNNNKHISFLRC